MTRTSTPSLNSQRMDIARAVVAECGTQAEFARRAGLSPAGALRWLRIHAPDTGKALCDGRRGLDGHTVLVRLLLLKSVEGIRGGQSRLGKALGFSTATLTMFRKTWAPDGIDAAIADLMPEEAHG